MCRGIFEHAERLGHLKIVDFVTYVCLSMTITQYGIPLLMFLHLISKERQVQMWSYLKGKTAWASDVNILLEITIEDWIYFTIHSIILN